MEELIEYIFGKPTWQHWVAATFFILLGQLLWKLISYKKKKDDTNFDLVYWFKDNYIDVLIAFITAFLAVRFSSYFITKLDSIVSFGVGPLKEVFLYHTLVGLCLQFLINKLRAKVAWLKTNSGRK